MKTYPSFGISRRSVWTANYSTFHHFEADVAFSKFACFSHVRGDLMLCAQAFNMASKMADVQIALSLSILLLQSG